MIPQIHSTPYQYDDETTGHQLTLSGSNASVYLVPASPDRKEWEVFRQIGLNDLPNFPAGSGPYSWVIALSLGELWLRALCRKQ